MSEKQGESSPLGLPATPCTESRFSVLEKTCCYGFALHEFSER